MRQQQRARSCDQARAMTSGDASIYLNACGTCPAPFPLAQLTLGHIDAHCESQAALTHRYSCHPQISQERSSGPSLLSTGDVLVRWAAACGLLDNSGAALLCLVTVYTAAVHD